MSDFYSYLNETQLIQALHYIGIKSFVELTRIKPFYFFAVENNEKSGHNCDHPVYDMFELTYSVIIEEVLISGLTTPFAVYIPLCTAFVFRPSPYSSYSDFRVYIILRLLRILPNYNAA